MDDTYINWESDTEIQSVTKVKTIRWCVCVFVRVCGGTIINEWPVTEKLQKRKYTSRYN
jgi:hypothetical protein